MVLSKTPVCLASESFFTKLSSLCLHLHDVFDEWAVQSCCIKHGVNKPTAFKWCSLGSFLDKSSGNSVGLFHWWPNFSQLVILNTVWSMGCPLITPAWRSWVYFTPVQECLSVPDSVLQVCQECSGRLSICDVEAGDRVVALEVWRRLVRTDHCQQPGCCTPLAPGLSPAWGFN